MQKVFEYATEADYRSSKRNYGDIYYAISYQQDGQRSITCISKIKETGQTVIDAVNVIVPSDKGELGDLLIYDNANAKYFWVKGHLKSSNIRSVGSTSYPIKDMYFYNTNTLGNVTVLGFMFYKEGTKCLIMALDYKYGCLGVTTNSIDGVAKFDKFQVNCGKHGETELQTWAGVFPYSACKFFGVSKNNYSCPITLNEWNTAIHNGEESFVWTKYDLQNWTIYYKDWNYDYEYFFRHNCQATFPTDKGLLSYNQSGKDNTKALVTSEISTPLADYCYAYDKGIDGFRTGDWWLASAYEYMLFANNLSKAFQVSFTYEGMQTPSHATSTGYSGTRSNVCGVRATFSSSMCGFNLANPTTNYYAFPITDFYLK